MTRESMARIDANIWRAMIATAVALLGWVGHNTHSISLEMAKLTEWKIASERRASRHEHQITTIDTRVRLLEGAIKP